MKNLLFYQAITFLFIFSNSLSSQTQTDSPGKNSKKDSLENSKLSNTQSMKFSNPSFYYTIFSDFKGFKGDQPNGIVQSEFFISVNRDNKTSLESGEKIVLVHNVVGGINIAKIGDNMRYKNLSLYTDNSGQVTKHIHYLDLIRYSNLESYLKVNLILIRMDKVFPNNVKIPFRIFIDGFINLTSTGIRDTTLQKEYQEFNANTLGFGGNLKLGTYFIPNEKKQFDLEFTFTPYRLYPKNNNFKTNGGPLFFPENNPLNNQFNGENYSKWIFRYDIRLQYAPNPQNSSGNIFFRIMYHTNSVERHFRDLGYKNNSYLQVQLGYVGTLNSLFPQKSEKD